MEEERDKLYFMYPPCHNAATCQYLRDTPTKIPRIYRKFELGSVISHAIHLEPLQAARFYF